MVNFLNLQNFRLIFFQVFLILTFFLSFKISFAEGFPKRIISLSPSITEMIFAVGAGPQVIAVDSYSNYPSEAPITSLSSMDPSLEAIAFFEPDLVFVSYDIGNIVTGLNDVGIKTILLPAALDFDEIISQIIYLGEITGREEQAKIVSEKMKAKMTSLVNLMSTKKSFRVYHEIDENYYSASSKSFIGNIYSLLNFTNIADEADKEGIGYPKLSPEYILSSDPEIIIISSDDKEYINRLKKRPGWRTVDAIKQNRVLILNPDIGSRWGPRIVDFANSIVKIIE